MGVVFSVRIRTAKGEACAKCPSPSEETTPIMPVPNTKKGSGSQQILLSDHHRLLLV
jgi:hypothetical protein